MVKSMSLHKVFEKLRRYNRSNYVQLKFCILFSVMLITSFISTVFNSAIQNTLPSGGDSRKMVYMIFVVAVMGCSVFSVYATGLFLRYRSRELGIFLALGVERRTLAKVLYRELLGIAFCWSGLGMVIGTAISYLTLCIFKKVFPFSIEEVTITSVEGIVLSILFSGVVISCVMALAYRFMNKTNIVDILNEQRKNESMKSNETKRYLTIGCVCFVVGILISGVGVQVYTRLMKQTLGAWINLFYILSLYGIYRILVYGVSVQRKGKNPQRYYQNMISYGMFRFQGSSIVKNMFVVSLLIVCSLFAALYSPTKYMAESASVRSNPIDFSLSYPLNADEINKADIHELAEQFGVIIRDYYEVDFIRLLGSGVNRDNIDENGKLIEQYEKERMYYSFINENAFNRITGMNIHVEEGTYFIIRNESMYENVFYKFSDLDYVRNTFSGENMNLDYAGAITYSGLVTLTGFDGLSRFVISDSDYAKLEANLPQEMYVRNILFNVEDLEQSYAFAEALYAEYCNRASANMLKISGYDEFQEQIAQKQNGYYGYADVCSPNAEHPEEYCDWKYAPNFKVLNINNGFISFGIFYMLFIYVMFICLVAVGIISYTRSMKVATGNKKVFNDIKKLGGNNAYIIKILSEQIKKVYVLPTILGCAIMLIWYPLMLWQNDGRVTMSEVKVFFVEILICVGIAIYQYAIYQFSMKQAKKVVIENEGV